MGDMAVSNSIGSNIFDVLLGLGFPWFLRTLVVDYGSVVGTEFFCVLIRFCVALVDKCSSTKKLGIVSLRFPDVHLHKEDVFLWLAGVYQQ
jgi:Ca2+/Na+ antiporter